jgi:hypothetical protein
MKLVYRDKGRVVCLAAGKPEIHAMYNFCEDSNRYKGAHIIAIAYHNLVSRYLCNTPLPFNLFCHCHCQVGRQTLNNTRR